MIEYDTSSARPGRARAEVSKIGHGCRKWMAYRKVFAMQKHWSVEVVRCINEWANGCWDANEMTWKNPRTNEWMNQWTNESKNQWINESVSQWISESMKQGSNDSMNQASSEPMSRWISESATQWINEPMVQRFSQWVNESMNHWTNEPMNQWMKKLGRLHVPKVLRSLQFFEIFMWNRALATVSCTFCQLHCLTVLRSLHMLLSLQSGAHFADLLFQKCSERHRF